MPLRPLQPRPHQCPRHVHSVTRCPQALRAEVMRQGAKIRELQAQVEELTAAKAKTPREDAAGATPSRRRATGLFGAAGRKKSVLSRAQ